MDVTTETIVVFRRPIDQNEYVRSSLKTSVDLESMVATPSFCDNMRTTCSVKSWASKFARSSHALYSTNDALGPREFSWVFTNGTFNLLAIAVSPNTVFLRGQPVKMSIYGIV